MSLKILDSVKMEVEGESAEADRVHGHAPPKPPDDDGGGGHDQQGVIKLSFRDKLLGAQEPLPRKEVVDLVGQKTISH